MSLVTGGLGSGAIITGGLSTTGSLGSSNRGVRGTYKQIGSLKIPFHTWYYLRMLILKKEKEQEK